MNRRILVLWILLAVFSLPAQAASGRDQLKQFFDGLTTFSAGFQQRTIRTEGRNGYAEGTFYLQRPGRFRWEYRTPNQLIVADGDRVWLFDKELEQVSHQGQDAALKGTPAQVLVETAPLENFFAVHELESSGGLDWVELRPLETGGDFERILLGLSNGLLWKLEMEDSFGQMTLFRFSEVKRNVALDPELFHYEPPSTMDVFGTD